MPHGLRHEQMARHLVNGTQHGQVADPPVLQGLDQPPPRAAILRR
jgi:hypothetical protein